MVLVTAARKVVGIALAMTVLAVAGCDDTGSSPASSTSGSVTAQEVAPPAASSPASNADTGKPSLSYVAFGDSWPYGGHCGLCTTFVTQYADDLEAATGATVNFTNLTTNGGGTAELAATLSDDEAARAAVASAEIVVIATGINDLDATKALDKVASGACGGPANDRCIHAMATEWRHGFEDILTTLDQLVGGRPVAVRLVGTENIFLSDPSIASDYGLPDGFARGGGELLIRELRDAICDAATRHAYACVDIWTLFNGENHDQVWDENSTEAHTAVAQAILDSGTDPLVLPPS